ncbi:esterase/lipase family protein [Paractinoplanes toevensis]|uniref:AB hydrolase-1 domain-containing protein n=1 Tax=Paractinoplanes toevensis TaxID=571911 RepID=A0A919W922_9ACTN|nr:alpha/beta fold hydrolase [Actinoplanes toevensis]GIM95825.1 hypothetical protein Ato02nite_076180 [Actinoplanes toevensis]
MKPIVLVHGFWVTPRSWEHWKAHYEAKGRQVIAPAYPGFEVEVEALNADPTPISDVTVPQIIAHYEEAIRALPEPRSSSGTRPAARSPRSCSTTGSARPAWPSTRRPPRGSGWCCCPS